jgi:predicted transposase/invertase (TIGR01784 family)
MRGSFLNITPLPNVSIDEYRTPGTTQQPFKFHIDGSFSEARRAAQMARRFFDSKNLIRPTGDLLFKKLMTESPDALLDLINRIVKPKTRFKKAMIKNPELLPSSDGEKLSRLDILVECDDNTTINVEMQCGPIEALEQRSMFYASKVYSSALPEGEAYGQLPRVIVIFLLEDAYFPNFEGGHQEFQMCRTWPPGKPQVVLSNDLPSLHFVELGKLRSSEAEEDPILLRWAGFMLPSSEEEWDSIASEDAMFSELKKKIETYSADNELAMRQRAIDEGRMGRQIELGSAYKRGKDEGREEGIELGTEKGMALGREAERKDSAVRLLAKGMSKEEIAELQGIDREELKTLSALE